MKIKAFCCLIIFQVMVESLRARATVEMVGNKKSETDQSVSKINNLNNSRSSTFPLDINVEAYRINLVKNCGENGICSYKLNQPSIELSEHTIRTVCGPGLNDSSSDNLSQKVDEISKQLKEVEVRQEYLSNNHNKQMTKIFQKLNNLTNMLNTKTNRLSSIVKNEVSLNRNTNHSLSNVNTTSSLTNFEPDIANNESKNTIEHLQEIYPKKDITSDQETIAAILSFNNQLSENFEFHEEELGSTPEKIFVKSLNSETHSISKESNSRSEVFSFVSAKLASLEVSLLAKIESEIKHCESQKESNVNLESPDPAKNSTSRSWIFESASHSETPKRKREENAYTAADQLSLFNLCMSCCKTVSVQPHAHENNMKPLNDDPDAVNRDLKHLNPANAAKDSEEKTLLSDATLRKRIEAGIKTQIEGTPLMGSTDKEHMKSSAGTSFLLRQNLLFNALAITITPPVLTTATSEINEITLPNLKTQTTSSLLLQDIEGSVEVSSENYKSENSSMSKNSHVLDTSKVDDKRKTKWNMSDIETKTSLNSSGGVKIISTAKPSWFLFTTNGWMSKDFSPTSSIATSGNDRSFEPNRTKVMSKAAIPYDCAEIYSKGERKSGVYVIRPRKRGVWHVYCDMNTKNGGWTTLQRRINGDSNFTQNWSAYRDGFGNVHGDYWIGLEKIHYLTTNSNRKQVLRIDLTDWDGITHYAQYDVFRVKGEMRNYQLIAKKYSGTAGDALNYGNKYNHDMQFFTTPDRDNDRYVKGNCGKHYGSGWWFNACFAANLNGAYHKGKYTGVQKGIYWGTWYRLTDEKTNQRHSFKSVDMKVRPFNFKPQIYN